MNIRLHISTALACTAALFSSCDSYLDVEPKGRTQLETTDDYLGLLEEVSPNYDHANSLNICNEASWYKVEELKNYTSPLRSAGFLWNEDYDRAAVTINSSLYNNCYNRITNFNVIISNIHTAKGPDSDKALAMAQAKS